MVSRELKKIALDRVCRLMDFARKHAIEKPEIAREAALLAMRIAQKARVRMPRKYKRMFCKKCGTLFWTPYSFTVRIRDRRSTHIVIKCLKCGYIKRIPVKKRSRSIYRAPTQKT
ncbi:MAG: ribonuclease P [Nitrososphaerota archaeon]